MERPKYLFGAGAAASWVLNGFSREGIAVKGFLDDSAARIGSVGGVPVVEPDRVESSDREDSVVVIAIMSPYVDHDKLRSRLGDLGWADVRTLSEFGRDLLSETGLRCGMLDAQEFTSHSEELAKVRGLLSDDHSRQVFDGFVSFVTDLDDSGFPPITPDPYFPADVPRWRNPLRMLDLGGFDGETVVSAIQHGYDLDAAISFEPDARNFAKLAATAQATPGLMALPLGVSDSAKVLRFSSQGDAGSFVSNDGDTAIQCVSLDEALPHFAPNLIKFDIEGSEQDALRGASNLISTYRPGLAVSLYHLSDDFWRIPLMIADLMGTDCEYRLRRHSHTIADTVLYVQPGE